MMVTNRRALARAAARGRHPFGWLVAASALAVTGCASRHQELVDFLRAHEIEVSTGHYVVRAPDAITVHSPDVPEIDGATQVVRSDGRIVLRLLGDVDVAGLTTEEIAAKLKRLLARYYVEPEVVIEVSGYRSQFYYVFGEVGSAGPQPYTGRDTLLKALAEAQPTFLAWRSQISVIRPSAKPGQARTITVDLDRMLKSGDVTEDFLLQEGDVIQVPPTPLAWIGHRIREVLYPVGPLMNAYTTPAAPIYATHAYEDEFSDSSDPNRRKRPMPSGFGG
jgi:polysaccharide export outer membrane protein